MDRQKWMRLVLAIGAGVVLLSFGGQGLLQAPRVHAQQPTQPAPADEPNTPARTDWGNLLRVPDQNPGIYQIGRLDPRSGYLMQLSLTNNGAAIDSLRLSRHFETVEDKRAYYDDPDAYPELVAQREELKGHYDMFRPVTKEGQRILPMSTRLLWVRLPGETRPRALVLWDVPWVLDQDRSTNSGDQQQAVYVYRVLAEDQRPILRLTKTYTIVPETYSVQVQLRIENELDRPLEVAVDQVGPTGLVREGQRRDMRRTAYAKLVRAENEVRPSLAEADDLPPEDFHTRGEPILWAGQVNKFFGSTLYAVPNQRDVLTPTGDLWWYAEPAQTVDNEQAEDRVGLVGVRVGWGGARSPQPVLELAPGGEHTVAFDLFAGPKERELFTNPEAPFHRPLYSQLKYIGTIEFGGCICGIDALSLLMMKLLQFLASTVAFGNYGVAIIILVVVVRLLLHPLTKKSQTSMMKMQKLAPQMQKIKEKYGDDKNAMNQEMMKLYKEGGSTPFLGCLPMLLQMPIWIGLYTGINATVELRHAAFLPVWLTDLSSPDALFNWGTDIWMIGETFNLLPILLCVAMFLQQKLNPQMSGQAAAGSRTKEQEAQQKMMRIMFPGMMLVFFYPAPSGLTLYVMSSMSASVAEQFAIRKHLREKEQSEQEVTVKAPGKKARGQRPKKPKGPSPFKKG